MFARAIEEMNGSDYGNHVPRAGHSSREWDTARAVWRIPAMGLQTGPSRSKIYTQERCPFGQQWRVDLHSESKSNEEPHTLGSRRPICAGGIRAANQ